MTEETAGQSDSRLPVCLSVCCRQVAADLWGVRVKRQKVEEDNERNSAGHFVSFLLIFKEVFSDVSSSTFRCCCFPQRSFSLWRVSEVRLADTSSHRHKGHPEKITNNNTVCCSLRGQTINCTSSFYKHFRSGGKYLHAFKSYANCLYIQGHETDRNSSTFSDIFFFRCSDWFHSHVCTRNMKLQPVAG